jgi:rhamnose utilization protein RhaD (predicted bifunctional aldolase and dehydrogenase)
LSGPGQLDKRSNLIGAEMRQVRHGRQNTSIRIMIARINNYSL